MPTNFKVTNVFAMGENNWTESFYFQADNPGAASVIAHDLAEPRAALLGKFARIKAVRLQNLSKKRKVITDFNPATVKDPETAPLLSDQPRAAILCRAYSGDEHGRQVWLRGCPDSWIAYDPVDGSETIAPLCRDKFKTFRDYVIKNGLSVKALNTDVAPTLVTGLVAAAGNPTVEIQIPFGPGLVPPVQGTKVRLSGGYGINIKQFNGLWTVFQAPDVAGVNHFFIVLPQGVTVPFIYQGAMVMALQDKTLQPITNLVIERFTTRATGKPLYQRPGSRRRAKSRR